MRMARSDEGIQLHGKKRPAEGEPDGTQPLAKRLGRLQIDNQDGPTPGARANPGGSRLSEDAPERSDAMLLDDTKYTTYIHNLDRELAEADSSEDGLVILPLAAKMMSVPGSVLSNTKSPGNELVLYREPSSLTVPQEQDSVRKAIIESRARARAETNKPSSGSDGISLSAMSSPIPDSTGPCSGDPMDLDPES